MYIVITADSRGSSKADWKVLKTKLPDGTVCEFFTSEDEGNPEDDPRTSARSPNNSIAADGNSDGEYSTCEPDSPDADRSNSATAVFSKRKASEDPLAQLDGLKSGQKTRESADHAKFSKKIVDIFDFEGVIQALDKESVCLPSSSWSYSLLNHSVLMFLCWDETLTLTKKAVLRKGCPLELYCHDRLLASKSELPIGNYGELELALRYLDKYEWCQGLDRERRSSKCELYILNGKSRCKPCDNLMLVLQDDHDDDSFTEEITEIPDVIEGDVQAP